MNIADIKAGQVPTPTEFEAALQSWLLGAQKRIIDRNTASFPSLKPDRLELERNKRYIRVWSQGVNPDGSDKAHDRSAFAFIDLTGGKVQGVPTVIGDVLKPDGWKSPAKHARGNIFDDQNGLQNVGPFGVSCMR